MYTSNAQGSRADSPDGLFADRDGVLPQRAPESVIETHAVLPQRPLAIVGCGGKSDCVLHERAILPQFSTGDFGEEGQSAGGDAPGLLAH